MIACFGDAGYSYCQSAQILNFEKLTINDGLSQGFIYNINQDDKGFMWFCTPDGLNRYDGYHFKIYRHDEEDSFSVSSNFVTKFFIDSHKNTWVATQDNGLNYFDIVHQKFYHLFPGQTIGDILEDKYGNLLINYRSRIFIVKIKKIEGDQLKKIQIDTTTFTLTSPAINPDAIATHRLFTDIYRNIYCSGRDGIYKLAYDKNLCAFNVLKLCSFSGKEDQPPKVVEDKASHKFYTHLNKHLVEFPGNNFSNPVVITSQPDEQSIFIDSKQTIWYGASQMSLVNANAKTIVQVIPKSNDIKDFLGTAYTAFEDRNGNVWLGTSGLGILKFSGDLDFFHHALPGTYVYHLQPYDKETVLVEGLYKVKISDNNSVNVDTISLPSSIKMHGQSSQLIIDSSGCYWLFSDNQLKFFNPKANHVRSISIKERLEKQNSSLTNVNVPDNLKSGFLFPDSHNNIWFQCFGKMMSYNIKKDSVHVYASLPAFEDVDKSFHVIYEDHQGVLWITTSQNFYNYNPSTQNTHSFYHSAKDPNSIAGSNVSCFCDDPLQPSEFLWIGTRGSGLSKMNKSTGKCTSVSIKTGLPNNVIYGLLADDAGNLWGSTNKGLFKLDVRNNSVTNFDVTDGLQGNEFNRYAYLRLQNGELIFGGLNGISYFKAKHVHSIPPPTLSLTNIRVLSKNLSVKDSGKTITEDVSYLKDLRIKSNQNVVSFEFAAMDYRKAGAVHYRYRLNGFDNVWSISDLSNTATYTNLNPGNYRFCVQASNDNITWSAANILLNLYVLPMWWQTWFFKIVVGCCVLAIGYAIYRYRLQQLLRIERMRNNIARDLHDEIGSSLSSISIFSKLALRRINTKEADPGILLQKINEDASHVMDSMSDIVWSINTKNDDLENVFYRMREHAIQLLEAKNYTVHFNFDERLRPVKLDIQTRRDLYLIYKEALNNIAKYADGKNVWIVLSLDNNTIELDIKDDGRGFDKTKMDGKGNGLSNMQKRADAIGATLSIVSKSNEGVAFHLGFPKK